MVSDLEKTIVDAATKPQYGGGILALGKAVVQSKDRIDFEKVIQYLVWNDNKSAKKRFLYLAEILGLKWTPNFERLSRELGAGYSLLDPSLPDKGKQMKRFGLKINVDPELIEKEVHLDS